MKVVVASDHRGYEAKRRVLPLLKRLGHEFQDLGCDGPAAVDYPDFAAPVARAVAKGTADVGILMDGSGIGMSIAANKFCGVRAALVHDEVTARRSREHNHCNVLCLGTDLLSEDQIRQIVEIFLSTNFVDGRHTKRIEKLKAIEDEQRQSHGGGGNVAGTANANAAASSSSSVTAPAPAGRQSKA
jgi:ribose 5-phosphate isomerase B